MGATIDSIEFIYRDFLANSNCTIGVFRTPIYDIQGGNLFISHTPVTNSPNLETYTFTDPIVISSSYMYFLYFTGPQAFEVSIKAAKVFYSVPIFD